ncbi:MAG: hypothetical protein KY453_01625 [Gemmatimonadetes bacterium]|nr:hypothetical protein [Gemmatimonadota bacterium]
MGAVTGRRGVTVVETLVTLLLLFLVVELTWVVTARSGRAAAALEEAAEALATERAAWWILREELALSVPGRDRTPAAGDSIALRAFRGTARVCDGDGDDGLVRVRHDGMRRPEPGKDSVLVLQGDGGWRSLDLLAVEGTADCASGEDGSWEHWRLGGPAPGAVLLRVYERGSYHLADGALRYRRGAAGRQPLTPEVLDGAGSHLTPRGTGIELRVRIPARRPAAPVRASWERTLRTWDGGAT